MDPESHVGRRVREVRSWRGLSLTAAAQLAGMSAANLSRIEHGQQGLSRKGTLESIAAALRVAPSELTGQPYGPTTPGEAEGHGAVQALRGALRDIDLGMADVQSVDDPDDALAQLDVDVARATVLGDACDYGPLGELLPSVLLRSHVLVQRGSARARLLLVRALIAAQQFALNLGYRETGYAIVQHLHAAALAVCDSAWIGVAEFLRAEALVGSDSRTRARLLVDRAARDTPPGAGPAGEAYGLLRLSGAYQAAVLGDVAAVPEYVVEAADVARHTGDGTFAAMHFGPRNVGVWRVALAVEIGDVESVPDLARDVDINAIPSPERQASFYKDLGRGLAARRGREDTAVEAFRRAEDVGPQLVHNDPYVREAIGDLLRRARRDAGGRELRGMAYRLGLGV